MELPDTKELEKIVKFCRKHGITSIKSGEFAIELSSSALFPESNYKKKQINDLKDPEVKPLYNEEEALFWSSAGISEGAN